MGQYSELRFLLAIVAIGLFTLSVYNAISLADSGSISTAYHSAVTAVFAFVWGILCWLSYEDPDRYKEAIIVTVMGLILLAIFESSLILTGAVPSTTVISALGQSFSLEDALWGESATLAALAILIFYFRPQNPVNPPEEQT